MAHQDSTLQLVHLVQIIAACPEIVVVARLTITMRCVQLVTDFTVTILALLLILLRVDEVVQHVDVFAHVTARVTNQTVRAVVVVVRSVGSHRDDAFQPVYSCCRRSQWQCPLVGCSRHSDLASTPRGFHFFVAIHGLEPLGAAIQPIDHSLGCQ